MSEFDMQKVSSFLSKYRNALGDTWMRELEKEDPIFISAVISRLHYPEGRTAENFNAIRDGAKLLLEHKLNEKLISTLEHLDKSATRLQWIGLALSAVIGVAAIVITFFS